MLKKRYTADMIIVKNVDGVDSVVLIERKNFPFGYAIAGGFRDVQPQFKNLDYVRNNPLPIPPKLDDDCILENSMGAAKREAFEETLCATSDVVFLGRYDDINRDPRGYTVSDVYYGKTVDTPVASDDAANTVLVPINNLHQFLNNEVIAFDHKDVLLDFLNKIK